MPRVVDVLRHKGSAVMTIGPDARAIDAALLMNEHKIGALVVLDVGQIVGIISERDMMRRVVAERKDPEAVPVHEVMTRPVITCQPEATLDEARRTFQTRRIRHLPVVDEHGGLEGLISIGDLNAWELNGQEVEIQYLHEYIYGNVA